MRGPSKARFDELFAKGQRANGRYFRVCSLPGSGLVGVATARTLGGHARRNRQKRRAREAYNALGVGTVELDIAVVVKAEADHAAWEELQEDLGRLLEETTRRWAEGSES